MSLRFFVCVYFSLLLAPACAQGPLNRTPAATYGSHLLAEAAAKDPSVASLDMYILPANNGGQFTVLSTRDRVPETHEPRAREVIETGAVIVQPDLARHQATVDLPLLDAVGTRVGVLVVTFSRDAGYLRSKLASKAEAIRDKLRRRTIDQSNLLDPFPFDAAFGIKTYGQHLVDAVLDHNPDVLVLGIHAQPPDGTASIILASSFGRIGKKDDEGDLKIARTSQPSMAVVAAGNRFNIGLPLKDMLGKTIGLLTVAFAYKAGDDRDRLLQRAMQVRDALSRRVLDVGSLAEPYPYDPHYSAHIHAQDLVEEILASHPHLLGVGMHVTPPGGAQNVIIASTFGRIGKESDESDLQMIRSNQPNMAVWAGGHRYSGQVILHDRFGNVIGSLLLIFPYESGDDQAQLLRQAERVQGALAKKITSVAELMAPVKHAAAF